MRRTVKSTVQGTLKSAGLYQRVKASALYDVYWRFFNPRLIEQRSNEVDFYRSVLNDLKPGSLIFDVGANQGSKTDVFLRLGARVIAVDPDETNQRLLREKFLKLRLTPKPVTIVGSALSDKVSVETMWITEDGSALNTLSSKWVNILREDEERFGSKQPFAGKKEVTTTTLDALIGTHGVPVFIKIDVEGYEPEVLRGLTRSVPCLSFEVNLPEFRSEGVDCIAQLSRLDPAGSFNYVVDCRNSSFRLASWVQQEEFSEIFECCTERSLEVFWKSSQVHLNHS